jgi:hypothetical protein
MAGAMPVDLDFETARLGLIKTLQQLHAESRRRAH